MGVRRRRNRREVEQLVAECEQQRATAAGQPKPRGRAGRVAVSGKRSPQRIAKWFRACGQPCIVGHCLATCIRAKYSSLIAASSLGKEPRVLITLRRVMFRDSTALVDRKSVV